MSIRMVAIKDEKSLGVFQDIVSLQITDGNIEAVIVTVNGEELRITKADQYSNSVKVSIKEPLQEVVKYSVEGTIGDLKIVPEVFDTEYLAIQYVQSTTNKFYSVGCELKVVSVSEFVPATNIK